MGLRGTTGLNEEVVLGKWWNAKGTLQKKNKQDWVWRRGEMPMSVWGMHTIKGGWGEECPRSICNLMLGKRRRVRNLRGKTTAAEVDGGHGLREGGLRGKRERKNK